MKTYKGTLEFLDMTNGDVDNGRFESEVSGLRCCCCRLCSVDRVPVLSLFWSFLL